MFFTWSSKVNILNPYFLGVSYGVVATIADSNKKRRQIRIGLIWWHVGITVSI